MAKANKRTLFRASSFLHDGESYCVLSARNIVTDDREITCVVK